MNRRVRTWSSRSRLAPYVAGLVLVLAACDSNEDDPDGGFAGTWNITRIEVDGTNILPALTLAGISGMGATFGENGTFVLFAQTSDGSVETAGTYSSNPQNGVLVLSSDSFEAPIEIGYTLSGNTIELTSDDASLLAELAGIELPFPLQGSLLIRLSRQ